MAISHTWDSGAYLDSTLYQIEVSALTGIKRCGKELQEGAVREKEGVDISNLLRSMSPNLYVALF